MKLLVKFNVILGIVLGTGLLLTGTIEYIQISKFVQEQIKEKANLMMSAVQATREYTSTEIEPLLTNAQPAEGKPGETTSDDATSGKSVLTFYPQSVPAYAARRIFENLQADMRKRDEKELEKQGLSKEDIDKTLEGGVYEFKEASENPSNKNNACMGDVEPRLYAGYDSPNPLAQFVPETRVDGKKYQIVHEAIKCKKECLACHEKAEPPTPLVKAMLASDEVNYSPTHGFNWKDGKVVAVRMVKIPVSAIEERRNTMLIALILNLVVVAIVTFVSLNIGLILFIIRPVTRVSSWAEEVSTGNLNLGKLPVKGKDEIAAMTESFNRMYISLVSAMNMLKKGRR